MLAQKPIRGLPAIRTRQTSRAIGSVRVASGRGPQIDAQEKISLDCRNAAALLALSAFVAVEQPALAQEAPAPDAVDSAIETVIEGVKVSGDFAKSAISALGQGVDALYKGYQTAAPYLEDTYKKAQPALQSGADVATKVATEAAKIAKPIIQNGVSEVESLLESSGVNSSTLQPVVSTATKTTGQAITVATPWFQQVVDFLTTTEPVTLGQYAIGIVALYYTAPFLFGGLLGSLRGYSGDVTPAAALDTADKDGNAYIVDIRPQKDKEQLGVPDIPSRNKVIDINYAEIDRKIRGQLRDPDSLEAKTTALQIASYKRLSKGNLVLLLDKYGNQSKSVAKELAKLGFGKTYIITGGFEGRNGWVQSKLQIRGFTAQPRATGLVGTLLSTGTVNTRAPAKK